MSLLELQKELKKFNHASKLTGAVQDVDRLIDFLVSAREEVAAGTRSPRPLAATFHLPMHRTAPHRIVSLY